MRTPAPTLPFLLALFALFACGDDTTETTDSDESIQRAIVGHCDYNNPFSGGPECKEYSGEGWDEEGARADCDAPLLTAPAGTFTADLPCDVGTELGRCLVDGGSEDETILVFPGDDPSECGGVQTGCLFGQGEFQPSDICADDLDPGVTSNVFIPFAEVCVDPLDGDPPGAGPEGKVCTIEGISACTEEDRAYIDHASCDPVFTQRPYNPYPVTANTAPNDDRLSDPTWQAEFDWVTRQVEACACVCCHSSEIAPRGPSGWYIEADPIWIDTLGDAGLAMLAGWVDSVAFGAIDPADNNGFDRETTGLPTSDVPRMVAFLEGELARRGKSKADFANTPAFGGPLHDQLFYEPGPCNDRQGLNDDGELIWTGGPARYLYILSPDSMAPGVPPNLDLPAGTLWRWDVHWEDDPVRGPIRYGQTPSGATQVFPESGDPEALKPGETYYLYALRDVYMPASRCLFTVPEE